MALCEALKARHREARTTRARLADAVALWSSSKGLVACTVLWACGVMTLEIQANQHAYGLFRTGAGFVSGRNA